eukprot:TRINITY_DN74749_c0_g1_i1.p1 TRINITY_DN74749_c0_g1~~TRINITY_DN74749_c0_g1_i1.p1  ORF type:complete len:381 (+),score=95.69 TRINITY_DN74749_c0_g1_i1:69-1211(+)
MRDAIFSITPARSRVAASFRRAVPRLRLAPLVLLAGSVILAWQSSWRRTASPASSAAPADGRAAENAAAAFLFGGQQRAEVLPAEPLDASGWERLLAGIDLFVFDCDGVIWRGDTLIEGVKAVLEKLRALGKKVVFVTNNSTRSRKQYVQKFHKLGLDFVTEENIFASSFAAAAYLKKQNFKKKAYVIGEDGIIQELEAAGIQWLGGPSDAGRVIDLETISDGQLELDPDVGAIVVGFDRHVNYYKLQYATKCLRQVPGCMFVATNRDAVTHLTAEDEWAGGGATVAAVAASSEKQPVLVGKPAQFMTEFLTAEYGVPASRICMVGDRLDTDMMFGKAGGMRTLLVLTGVTSEAKLRSQDAVIPDHYVTSLGAAPILDFH